MKTLNITKGEASAVNNLERVGDFCIHSFGTKICELPDFSEESMQNARLIVDTFNTYNTTLILPSELLKQRNELLESLKEITTQFQKVEPLYSMDKVIIKKSLTAIKNATNA